MCHGKYEYLRNGKLKVWPLKDTCSSIISLNFLGQFTEVAGTWIKMFKAFTEAIKKTSMLKNKPWELSSMLQNI